MALSGSQAERLTQALASAFPTFDLLSNLLWFKCDKDLAQIAGPHGLDVVVPQVIKRAQAEGWLERLIKGALVQNPGSAELRAYYGDYWLAIDAPPRLQVEALVRPANPMLDVDIWADGLVTMGPRVCRVEIPTTKPPGPIFGTGFLVAPDVVMTNYHVFERVIRSERDKGAVTASAGGTRFRFDYKRLPGGGPLNDGKTFALAAGGIDAWLLDSSETGGLAYAATDEPTADQLDYVLLRIDGRAGADVVRSGPADGKRGWIRLGPDAPAFAENSGLLILQHPSADPLKLAIDMQAIERVNGNRTRVYYRTNTLPGSSGAPCFDPDWTFVALHHAGDPSKAAKNNRGTPVDMIHARMTARNTARFLGSS